MKIINPIYDNAFKYLMDNEQIAKIVLSIILDTKVVSLQSRPQETPLVAGSINISRFDFKAIIQNKESEHKTVLIELQKYKNPNTILRFRRYLATNYLKEETIINSKGKEQAISLPIITIYILGFDLPEYNCRAIRIDNKPFDIIGQKELIEKNEFVELLTHQSFVLIAVEKDNIEKSNTRLEKFLNLFIQKLQNELPNPIIDIKINTKDDPEFQSIVDYLNNATLDEKLIRSIDAEKDYYKGIEELEQQVEKAKAGEEKAKAGEEESKARERKTKEEMVKIMIKYGETDEEIENQTGLSKDDIKKFRLKK